MSKKIVSLVSFFSVGTIILLLTLSLSGRKNVSSSSETSSREEVTDFHYEKMEAGLSTAVWGEAATISQETSSGTIIEPAARLETADNKIILIHTGPQGTAEINLDSEKGNIKQIILKGRVTITRKDKKSGVIEFTAEAERAEFNYSAQEMILTGNPVIRQGENEFRGEIIRYLLRDGKIFIEKGASGKVYYEEKKPSS